MNTAEMTMAMAKMWIDWTLGIIQETFWIVRLRGVALSHSANACSSGDVICLSPRPHSTPPGSLAGRV